MSRREIFACLHSIAQRDLLPIYRLRCLPQRNIRYFFSRNVQNTNPQHQQSQSKQVENVEPKHDHRHLHDLIEKDFKEVQKQFVKEFDDFHKHFFNQLPLRRYAFLDEFSKLDQIFNQEFNRMRNSFFEPTQEASQSQKEKDNAKTEKSTQSSTAQQGQSDNQNVQTQESDKLVERAQNRIFDINSFFESTKSISDVRKFFNEEQQRLEKMIEKFEADFEEQIKSNDPNVHTIRSYYKRTPEGESRGYYDSKNPEQSYKVEKKFENPTISQSSTAQDNKSSSTQQTGQKLEVDQQAHINPQTQNVETKQEQMKKSTDYSVETPNSKKSDTVQGDQKDISPELNKRAQELSNKLKKEYPECLELVRKYPNKSLDQIAELVAEEQKFVVK